MRIRSLDDLPASIRDRVAQQFGMGAPSKRYDAEGRRIEKATAKPGKYRNQPVVVDGERFDSKLEARYYEQLKRRRAAGEVLWFIRQPSFFLAGVRYRADFLVVLAAGGVEVIDVKGLPTQASLNKIKQVKAIYGVDVKLVRKVA